MDPDIEVSLLAAFIYEQYLALPIYLRWGFFPLYSFLHLRGPAPLRQWDKASFKPLQEFLRYHRSLIAFYVFSQEEQR